MVKCTLQTKPLPPGKRARLVLYSPTPDSHRDELVPHAPSQKRTRVGICVFGIVACDVHVLSVCKFRV